MLLKFEMANSLSHLSVFIRLQFLLPPLQIGKGMNRETSFVMGGFFSVAIYLNTALTDIMRYN
jgi:hypothetical protein